MIPTGLITEWRQFAPWQEPHQVEQDLVISKALVQIYSDQQLKTVFAFRGGTSLQKIFFPTPTRYSEDIDLVQVPKEKIGPSINRMRELLDPWLGEPRYHRADSRYTLKYTYDSEEHPVRSMRLKIEINTGEHFSALGHTTKQFRLNSSWFAGEAEILTYEIEEILGTKMRALYQRKKGRDLYDMDVAFSHFENLNQEQMISCFTCYMEHGGTNATRMQYEANLHEKLHDNAFLEDIQPLLKAGSPKFDVKSAGEKFKNRTLSLLPGAPWPGPQAKEQKKKPKPT
jgi:predicted nucleotidyltransferase component of viral defense system